MLASRFIVAILIILFSAKSTAIDYSSKIQHYDLPLQSLVQGLHEFAVQSGVSISVSPELIKDQYITPIYGHFNVEKALDIIISKSALRAHFYQDIKSFVLLPKSRDSTAVISSLDIDDESSSVEEIVIIGDKNNARYLTLANSLSDSGVSYFDSARFHNMFSNQLINDIEQESLIDLLEYSGGISRGYGLGATNDEYYVRGYRRKNLYVDGFRVSDRTSMMMLPETLEKIELLKGPSMLFYGQSGAGGVVDVSRLSPLNQSTFRASSELGGQGNHRTTLDINDLMNGESQWKYRAIGILEEVDDHKFYASRRRVDRLFSINGTISEKFHLRSSYQLQTYSHSDLGNLRPLTEVGDFLSRYNSELFNEKKFNSKASLLNFSLNYFPEDDWRYSVSYQWQEEKRLGLRDDESPAYQSDVFFETVESPDKSKKLIISQHMLVFAGLTSCASSECSKINRVLEAIDQEEYETDISMRLTLSGNIDWLSTDHKLLLGVDLYHQDLYQYFKLFDYQSHFFDEFIVGEIDQNSFSRYWTDAFRYPGMGELVLREYRVMRDDYGLFGQLYSYWSPKWWTSFGWRYSYFDGEQRNISQREVGLMSNASDISPQIGLVFQPVEDISFFANYSESVAIRYLIDDNNNYADKPEVARQWEAGLKWLGMPNRLSAAVALFNIRKSNSHRVDLESGRRELIGPFNKTIAGIEGDVSISLDDTWQLISHFSLLDTKIESNGTITIAPYTADVLWGLFTRKQFFESYQATIGIRTISDRSMNYDESVKLPAYKIFDATLTNYLKISNSEVEVKLIIDNIFDKRFVESARLNGYVSRPAERNFRLKVKIAFH